MLSNPLGTDLIDFPGSFYQVSVRVRVRVGVGVRVKVRVRARVSSPTLTLTLTLIDFPGSFYQHVMKAELSGFATCVDAHSANLKAAKPKGA